MVSAKLYVSSPPPGNSSRSNISLSHPTSVNQPWRFSSPPVIIMASTAPPTTPKQTYPASQTLYIQNLNDKIRKEDLRISLYTLFSTYGCVLDVNALKTMKCRGQAHIAFRDIISATQAMRALHGVNIYGKDMVCAGFGIILPQLHPTLSA